MDELGGQPAVPIAVRRHRPANTLVAFSVGDLRYLGERGGKNAQRNTDSEGHQRRHKSEAALPENEGSASADPPFRSSKGIPRN